MTLEQAKELYPKFYKNPANYLGIEVEYTNVTTNAKGTSILDIDLLSTLLTLGGLNNCIPKFKPQEGEAFIKDLEEAVMLGSGRNNICYVSTRNLFYEFEGGGKILTVLKEYLSQVLYCKPFEVGEYFDTASYVDEMRKRGYYL